MTEKKKKHVIKEEPLTYDDYAKLPSDGVRYELVDGILQAMTPAPHPIHQLVNQELGFHLKETCHGEYIIFSAPIDLILSEKEVRQPDLLMVHRERLDIVTKRGIEGKPDLVVEILSPTSMKRDRLDKLKTYAAYNIPEYWLIDPIQKFLEQYRLEKERYELRALYVEDEIVTSDYISCVAFSSPIFLLTFQTFPICKETHHLIQGYTKIHPRKYSKTICVIGNPIYR